MPSQLDKLLAQALQLSPEERTALRDALAASAQRPPETPDEPPFSDADLQQMLAVSPRAPGEIVTLGLLGTWAEQGIEDGADWINARKRERQARQAW
jgi:hypothetical protein